MHLLDQGATLLLTPAKLWENLLAALETALISSVLGNK